MPTLPKVVDTTSPVQQLSFELAILFLLLKELVLWQKRVVQNAPIKLPKSTPISDNLNIYYF
jgi:hypothetical protein